MVDITFHGSFEEMMDNLGRVMKDADTRVNPTQVGIKPSQHFINFCHGPEPTIFGEILDIS